MELNEIAKVLDGEVLAGHEHLGFDIQYCYGCDLMSDVLAYVKNNVLLLTGLVHQQVIRTADMLDLKAIIFVRGKEPSEEMIEMANENGMVLIATKHSLYTACGLLFKNGLQGEEITHEVDVPS